MSATPFTRPQCSGCPSVPVATALQAGGTRPHAARGGPGKRGHRARRSGPSCPGSGAAALQHRPRTPSHPSSETARLAAQANVKVDPSFTSSPADRGPMHRACGFPGVQRRAGIERKRPRLWPGSGTGRGAQHGSPIPSRHVQAASPEDGTQGSAPLARVSVRYVPRVGRTPPPARPLARPRAGGPCGPHTPRAAARPRGASEEVAGVGAGWAAGWVPGWVLGWAPGWALGWVPGWALGWVPGHAAGACGRGGCRGGRWGGHGVLRSIRAGGGSGVASVGRDGEMRAQGGQRGGARCWRGARCCCEQRG